MLWFLVGAAFALPPALLGPDGPMWVGPLPPGPDSSLVVVVDPELVPPDELLELPPVA